MTIKKKYHKLYPASGFTLIEVVLALTLSAVVLSIVYSAMHLSYRTSRKGEARMDRSQHIRTLVDRLVPVIHSAYPLVQQIEEDRVLLFSGESDSLGLVTADVDKYRPDNANLPGLRWVRFFVDDEGLNMEESYFFNEDVLEEEAGEIFLVDSYVTNLEFEYYEIKEDESEGTWLDEWDPDDEDLGILELPRAVRVHLTIEEEGREIEIPPFTIRIYAYEPVR